MWHEQTNASETTELPARKCKGPVESIFKIIRFHSKGQLCSSVADAPERGWSWGRCQEGSTLQSSGHIERTWRSHTDNLSPLLFLVWPAFGKLDCLMLSIEIPRRARVL